MAKKKFWTSEKIVAFSAMFISVLTLYIFIRQTNLIETQNHLSTMPYLLFDASQNGEENIFSIDLVNYGVGPVIIENMRIFYKGESYEMGTVEFFQKNIPEMERDSINVMNYSSIRQGIAIPANGRRNIVTIGGSEKNYRDFLKIFSKIQGEGFNYQIKYKSIYNDHWQIESKSNIPEKIE